MHASAGVPVGFKLAPAPTPPMYAHPTNEHARRGAFATKQLWVTPHSDDEKWPAGKYPLGGDMSGMMEGGMSGMMGMMQTMMQMGPMMEDCTEMMQAQTDQTEPSPEAPDEQDNQS